MGQKWQGERSFTQFKKDAKRDEEERVRAPTGILARAVEKVDTAATTTTDSAQPVLGLGAGGGGAGGGASASSLASHTIGPPDRHLPAVAALGAVSATVVSADQTEANSNDGSSSSSSSRSNSSSGGSGGGGSHAFASAGSIAHLAKMVKRKGKEAVEKKAAAAFGTDSVMGFGRSGGLGEDYVPSQPGHIK